MGVDVETITPGDGDYVLITAVIFLCPNVLDDACFRAARCLSHT